MAAMVLLVILVSAAASAQTNEAQFAGRPEFSGGDALGYFVWKDGDTWKLRWTTFGAKHRFTGRITVEGGELRDFKRVDVDQERKVLAPGRPARVVRGPRGRAVGVQPGRGAVVATRTDDHIEQESEHLIVFNTETDDDLDGVDFKVTAAATLIRMNLQIDGQPRPAEVEVGRNNVKPNANPLVIRLR
jgi:hypothetical protein